MKNNMKKLFIVGLAALLTGCTAKNTEITVDFYTASGYSYGCYEEYIDDYLFNSVFTGVTTHYSKYVTGTTTSESNYEYTYEIDFKTMTAHFEEHYTYKYVDQVDAENNVNEDKTTDLYYVVNKTQGLIRYTSEGEEKTKKVLYTVDEMYSSMSDSTIDQYARYLMYDTFSYLIDYNAMEGCLYEVMDSSNENSFVGMNETEGSYIIDPTNITLKVNASGKTDDDVANFHATLSITSTIANGFVEDYCYDYSSLNNEDLYRYIYSVANKKGGNVELPDFSNYIPEII